MKKILKKTIVLGLAVATLSTVYSCKKENDQQSTQINVADGITKGTGQPNNSTTGDYYFDTNTKILYRKQNGTWVVVATLSKMTPNSSLLNGNSAPTPDEGKNGDYYVDTSTGTVYVKEDNAWKPFAYPSEDSIIAFKDPIFKAHMVQYNDANKDGEISIKEAKEITAINVAGLGISDLTGIEYCYKLQELNISNNKITSLNAKNLTQLKKIIATGNAFIKLDLSKSPLVSGQVKIVNDNANLESIIVGNKTLADRLNTDEKTNKYTSTGEVDKLIVFKDAKFKEHVLGRAGLDKNGDKEVSEKEAEEFTGAIHPNNAFGIKTLEDVKYFKNITTITITGENVNSATFENFPNLTSITIGNCELTSISITNVPKLTKLSLNGNSFTNLTLSNIPTLTDLSLNGKDTGTSPLKSININGLTNLMSVSLLNNNQLLSTLDLTGLTNLHTAQIVRNNNNSQITTINVATTAIANVLNSQESTSKYKSSNGGGGSSEFVDIPDANLKRLINRQISNLPITKTNLATITELKINNSSITNLSGLEYCTGLTTLECSASVSTLDITPFTKLKKLEISGNTLTTVNMGNVTTLTEVTIGALNVRTIDLSKNTGLTKVSIIQNMNVECVKVPANLVTTLQNTTTYKKDVIKSNCN